MIVLDTHTLIWWVNGDSQISANAMKAIESELNENGQILLSAITAWEITMLNSKGRLTFGMDVTDWLKTVEQIEQVRFVPLENDVLIHSVNLPGQFHADPADRMIVAQARHLNCPLVTADEKILDYSFVKTIW